MKKVGRIKGYKVFGPGWICDPAGTPFQYAVGETYEMEEVPIVCERGFHFCERAVDCFNYYDFDPKNKVAEIEALGDIDSDGSKSCTNKIHIIREIPWQEILDLVNTGNGCTGMGNSGDWNSGNRNSGNCNSGDCNSGNWNSGNWNSGDWNSGDQNSGNCNSGDQNSGDWNSGNRNSGDQNSGDWNSGDQNSGDWNSGNGNSGDWNSCSYSSGCFNTIEHKMFLFNKLSDWTYHDWIRSDARRVLSRIPHRHLKQVSYDSMSDTEKEANPEAKTTGTFLRIVDNPDVQNWWRSISDEDKKAILSIPNFNKAIFKEITGVDVDKN